VTSLFDRQTNCLTSPERELVWAFLTVSLDPLVPGVLATVYNAAWVVAGGIDGVRECAFRGTFRLINVNIAEVEFVITGVRPWFSAWATDIGTGASDPFGSCPCDSF
jgi:hypothetical protein